MSKNEEEIFENQKASAEAAETPAAVEAVEAVEVKADAPAEAAKAAGGETPARKGERGNRAQKVGIVSSDKMEKTCVVRVDRLIKHPRYRRYVRRRSKIYGAQ